MRLLTATFAALITLLAGCEIYTDDSTPTVDAGQPETCPPYWLTCEPGALRSSECRVICTSGKAQCPGADMGACYSECIAEVHTWQAYCPPG